MMFYRTFVAYLKAEVSRTIAFEQLMMFSAFPTKTVLKKMYAAAKKGQKISSVMKQYPKKFPELIVQAVAHGEERGLTILEGSLEEATNYLEKEYFLRRNVSPQ